MSAKIETSKYITPVIDEMLSKLAVSIYPQLQKKNLDIDIEKYRTFNNDEVLETLFKEIHEYKTRPEKYFNMKTLTDFTDSLKEQYDNISFDLDDNDENDE